MILKFFCLLIYIPKMAYVTYSNLYLRSPQFCETPGHDTTPMVSLPTPYL